MGNIVSLRPPSKDPIEEMSRHEDDEPNGYGGGRCKGHFDNADTCSAFGSLDSGFDFFGAEHGCISGWTNDDYQGFGRGKADMGRII